MKIVYCLSAILFSFSVYSQTTVTVDAGNVLRVLSGKENGINVDYLMDGSYLSPAVSPSQSLKNIKAKLLRYPGGEKSDNYLFSVSPYSSSSPRMALRDTCFWPSNDSKFVDTLSADRVCLDAVLDFDEYIIMCNEVGATPLVVVAYDAAYNTKACKGKPTKAQLLTNAVEWVRYANVKKEYGVQYWMIGNESWNDGGYNGKVTPSKYAEDLEDFAIAMKAVDPSIKIIANGRAGWWETILKSSAVSLIDFLGFSVYPVSNYTGGYSYYQENDVNLTGMVDNAIADINTYAPDAHKSRIKVIATEYNSIDWNNAWANENNLGHAIVNFQMFGDMIVKPELEAACMWNTRWVENTKVQQSVYDAFDAEGGLNATGKAMNVWGSNLLTAMVEATSNDPLVKTYASYDEAGKKLNIFFTNKSNALKQAKVSLQDYENDFTGSLWQFTGTSGNDKYPEFERIDSIYEAADISVVDLPANSVTVLRLQKDDVALPVTLVNFEAKKFDTGVTLNWETSDEKNITEYIVERSSDGSIFSAIGTVTAKNIDSSLYVYTDTKLVSTPVLYYRLIVVDTGGTRVSSRLVSVTIDSMALTVLAHPNPFEGTLQVKVISGVDKMINLILVDISGKIIVRQRKLVTKGNNIIEINNLNRLMKGMYMLRVGDDAFSNTVKVVKR